MFVYTKRGGSLATIPFGVNLHLFLQCKRVYDICQVPTGPLFFFCLDGVPVTVATASEQSLGMLQHSFARDNDPWNNSVIYILNKSENATPELFAIYIQNYANQECNSKCILMYKYWVMHNSKSYTDVVTRKHMKVIKMWQGSNISSCKFEHKISHSLGL